MTSSREKFRSILDTIAPLDRLRLPSFYESYDGSIVGLEDKLKGDEELVSFDKLHGLKASYRSKLKIYSSLLAKQPKAKVTRSALRNLDTVFQNMMQEYSFVFKALELYEILLRDAAASVVRIGSISDVESLRNFMRRECLEFDETQRSLSRLAIFNGSKGN